MDFFFTFAKHPSDNVFKLNNIIKVLKNQFMKQLHLWFSPGIGNDVI